MTSAEMDGIYAELTSGAALPRLWARDHTLWRPDPREISDRLGWLDVVEAMQAEEEVLGILGEEARRSATRDVVLLGMGGSSLGAEALRGCLPAAAGAPRLHVLDSTVPAWVRGVRDAVDVEHTVFVVASKSGTTSEVQALLDYFWGEAERELSQPGERFVAITDPGTPLADTAAERGFRRLFLNPDDIGGRFSVLSYFGLVPAALVGIDVGELLARAAGAAADCGPDEPIEGNPAAVLAAFLAAGLRRGRDKLTLRTAPRLATFGLWVEQLLAESTGKQGRGVLPVVGEPAGAPDRYGDDRQFVVLHLTGEGDEALAAEAEALRGAGLPVLELELSDPYDLGRELFIWEMATALVGHLVGVHPFDQPDVQAAKDRTRELLSRYAAEGVLPQLESAGGDRLEDELRARPPAYLALLAYLPPSAALEAAVADLRRAVVDRTGIATTFGYGPRYLHSTGQLHKGGPRGGLHVELLPQRFEPLPIPGRGYGFEVLAAAQAAGDALALEQAGRRWLRWECEDPAAEVAALARRLAV